MRDSLQFGDRRGVGAFAQSFLGRLVAAIVGLAVLGVALFLGAIFLAVVIGLVLLVGIIFSIRIWWLKRQMEKRAREHGDLEAEYVEIHESTDEGVRHIEISKVTRDD
jgi:ABC-type bacteriocin/lantibiotic exporter with double-glycine peptidase domain